MNLMSYCRERGWHYPVRPRVWRHLSEVDRAQRLSDGLGMPGWQWERVSSVCWTRGHTLRVRSTQLELDLED